MSVYLKPFLATCVFLFTIGPLQALADTAAEIDRDADAALQKLYKSSPAAVKLSETAKGILVYPDVIKAGLLVGGQYGEGALRVAGKAVQLRDSIGGTHGHRLVEGPAPVGARA